MKMDEFARRLQKDYPAFAGRQWYPEGSLVNFDDLCTAMCLEVGLPVRENGEQSFFFLDRLYNGIAHYHTLREAEAARAAQEQALKASPHDKPGYGGEWS